MRWRVLSWMGLGLLFLAALSPSGRHWVLQRAGSGLRSAPARFRASPATAATSTSREPVPSPPQYRLSNTDLPLAELARKDSAILLENALIDSQRPLPQIPSVFRNPESASAFIVQGKTGRQQKLREVLASAGGTIISYVPNNAFLVSMWPGAAEICRSSPEVAAVLPLEPYYKVKASLLKLVLAELSARPPSASTAVPLNVLCFGTEEDSKVELSKLGLQVTGRSHSPFGPVLQVRAALSIVPSIAALGCVQEVEMQRRRAPANDLSRARLGVAAGAAAETNYLGLNGTNVLIAVNDTGVDASHPALAGRVSFDLPGSGTDTNGHGTHVAGVIAGSGAGSTTVTNSSGSPLPPAALQFRGKAPEAQILSIGVDLQQGPAPGDSYLQEVAALSNAVISANSWCYDGDNEYDLAAAGYDAAVRDSLPGVSGSQPVLYLFAAGNRGAGQDSGTGGAPDTIQSPGTAKNVITVGAIEQPRAITNTVQECVQTTNGPSCLTNQPWLGQTDSSNQVAAFSSRGNVGIGTEGPFGRCKPDVVAPGTLIVSTRSEQWDQGAYYQNTNTASAWSDYFDVLRDLNQGLGTLYRFESGTSVAAAATAGTLALVQEFLNTRLAVTNSPAFKKALLISGSRSLGNGYSLATRSNTNFQGWGLVSLTNSIPVHWTNATAHCGPVLAFDASNTEALATGQGRTRLITVSEAAREEGLRATLVWTDPPANPLVGVKLVNDLDLVVTNLDSGQVFYGNRFGPGTAWSQAWDTNSEPEPDFVNNVEVVALPRPLGTNYSVTVFAHRVNVNAAEPQSAGIAQDYALVIASGDGEVADALSLTNAPLENTAQTRLTVLTNQFLLSSVDSGALLSAQRAGAHNPAVDSITVPLSANTNAQLSIGDTNQWQFYVITNGTAFTNALFLTFGAKRLELSPVELPNRGTATDLGEADIDLYVSQDPGLTNLDPQVVAAADRSLSRRGTEAVLYSNAVAGMYYAAVKCESARGAEFGFAAVFSQEPFSESDNTTNQVLRGFPSPAVTPGGSPATPAKAMVIAYSPDPMPLHRCIVTDVLSAESATDLKAGLEHLGHSVGLLDHPSGIGTNKVFIFDDSSEHDIPNAQATVGPGSLRDYAGREAAGPYFLTLTSTNAPGTNGSFSLLLEPQQDLLGGISATMLPGACREDFIDVPAGATNLLVQAGFDSGAGPFTLQAGPANSTRRSWATTSPGATNAELVLDRSSLPPLVPGLWCIRTCSASAQTNLVSLSAAMGVDPWTIVPLTNKSAGPLTIANNAFCTSTIHVTNKQTVVTAEVGLRVDAERLSDLSFSLLSPGGTRVLLVENRGAASATRAGFDTLVTNTTPVSSAGGPEASTNNLDTGVTSGVIRIAYDFFDLPDEMHVYYDGTLLFDSGLVSNTGSVSRAYGPGASTVVSIIMNEGGNYDTNTAWHYTVTSSALQPTYLALTENTNLTTTPIKFAPPPFDQIPPGALSSDAIYYRPEQSLDKLAGEPVCGDWTLEISSSRANPTNLPAVLRSWQLKLVTADQDAAPISVAHGERHTNNIPPGEVQWYAVSVPDWPSFATNSLVVASAPVNLLFNQSAPPTGTNAGDQMLLTGSNMGAFILKTNSSPALQPGATYYIGVQNTNATAVTAIFEVNFDVTPLADAVTLTGCTNAGGRTRYFSFDVSSNATAVVFELSALSGNADLVAAKGLPFPTLDSHTGASLLPGTNDEAIIMLTNSVPVLLAPGTWYLGVLNRETNAVSYAIQARAYSFALPEIATLQNGVPVSGTMPAVLNATDFYRYVVSTNAVRAQFEVNGPAADLNLALRKGLPLPSLTNFDLLSSNSGTNDELLVLHDYSTPIRLSPGEWFLCVVNPYGEAATYSIIATEWSAHGTNYDVVQQVASSNSFCMTWNSLAGMHYVVEGTPSVAPANWVPISPTITASDLQTSWCAPLPSPFQFYRVQEGLFLSNEPAPVHIRAVSFEGGGTTLEWNAPPSSRFMVQWSPSPAATSWGTFTNIITSTNSSFLFLDDGQQTGGQGEARFFRLIQLLP